MDCKIYRTLYEKFTDYPIPKKVWDTRKFQNWTSHRVSCNRCSDWGQAKTVKKRGYRVADFPCVHIADCITFRCDQHIYPHNCSDVILVYLEKSNEYGLPIRDGGFEYIIIKFCPWCGVKLPKSKRNSPAANFIPVAAPRKGRAIITKAIAKKPIAPWVGYLRRRTDSDAEVKKMRGHQVHNR